jgi:hypothetical protein
VAAADGVAQPPASANPHATDQLDAVDPRSAGLDAVHPHAPDSHTDIDAVGLDVDHLDGDEAPPERSHRPTVETGKPIVDYLDRELVAMIDWIESDGQLRTDDELLREVRDELGLNHGSRIDARILTAIETVRGIPVRVETRDGFDAPDVHEEPVV